MIMILIILYFIVLYFITLYQNDDEEGARAWLLKKNDTDDMKCKCDDDVSAGKKRMVVIQDSIMVLNNRLEEFSELVMRNNNAEYQINNIDQNNDDIY